VISARVMLNFVRTASRDQRLTGEDLDLVAHRAVARDDGVDEGVSAIRCVLAVAVVALDRLRESGQ